MYTPILLVLVMGCASKDKYDINKYYNLREQDAILTSIISHIYTAPLYTKMEDRFEPKHRAYYSSLTSKFKIVNYYVDKDSIHYFYVIRPSSIASEKRAVGGHYKMNKSFLLSDFREDFVTTVKPEKELVSTFGFLFDEMVKGNLKKYLGMKDYIQWPNEISYYDSVTYEWKLKPNALN